MQTNTNTMLKLTVHKNWQTTLLTINEKYFKTFTVLKKFDFMPVKAQFKNRE